MDPYDIVDCQIHLFLTMNAAECVAAMDSLGIQGALIDEFWGWDEEYGAPRPFIPIAGGHHRPIAPGAQMSSHRHPERLSYLLRVDRHDPEVDAVVRLAAQDPACRALRVEARSNAEVAAFAAGGYDAIFAAAGDAGLPVFVLSPGNAGLMLDYLKRHPGCTQIVDHIGLAQTPEAYREVLSLAEQPNAVLKWCHAHRVFPSPYPFAPAIDGLRDAIGAYGAERIMWASDFTAIRAGHRWGDALYYLRDTTAIDDAEKRAILGGTARRILGWDAPTERASPVLHRH